MSSLVEPFSFLETQLRSTSELLVHGSETLATAESCTGGLLSSALTFLPGASRFFLGGVSAYHNSCKLRLLGVSDRTLSSFGAVSEEVACEMALGVKQVFSSTFSISTTGVAGPNGGSENKPVGTVWICLAGESRVLMVRKCLFKGDRASIRLQAVERCLDLFLELKKGLKPC